MKWLGRSFLIIGTLLLALLLWALRNTTPDTPSKTVSALTTTHLQEMKAPAITASAPGEPGPMSPGKLRTASSGHLILDRETRRIFDEYLDVRSPAASDAARGKLQQALRKQLSGTALLEAETLMNNYIAYRASLTELEALPDASDISNTQQARLKIRRASELRSRYFDANIGQLFFADEDAMNDYTISQMEIMQDQSLSSEQKLQRLEELKKKLPYALP